MRQLRFLFILIGEMTIVTGFFHHPTRERGRREERRLERLNSIPRLIKVAKASMMLVGDENTQG